MAAEEWMYAHPRHGLTGKVDDVVKLDIGNLRIVYTDHQARHLRGEHAAMSIFRVEIASDETSAWKVDHQRQRLVGCRLVYSNIELSMLAIGIFIPCQETSEI